MIQPIEHIPIPIEHQHINHRVFRERKSYPHPREVEDLWPRAAHVSISIRLIGLIGAMAGITYLVLILAVWAGGASSSSITLFPFTCVLLSWTHHSKSLIISSRKSAICLSILSSRACKQKPILSSKALRRRSSCRSFWEFQALQAGSRGSALSLGSRPAWSLSKGVDLLIRIVADLSKFVSELTFWYHWCSRRLLDNHRVLPLTVLRHHLNLKSRRNQGELAIKEG